MNTPMPLRRHLCFLDVGHGNSTVLIAGEESVVVVDVGRQSTLSEFLLEQGIRHIESIYLSHADADHVGALTGIIATQQVSIGRVLFNGDGSKDTETWDDLAYELDRAANAGSLEAKPGLVAGEMEEFPGDVCLRVLGPSVYLATKGVGGEDGSGRRIRTNSISAVISIAVAGDTLALLPGDVDGVGLDDLLENGIDIRAPVLVYPHHGGRPGGSAEPSSYASTLLGAVNPRLVVFSIGRGHYSTPNLEVVQAIRGAAPGARLVCTQLSEHCAQELPDEPATHLPQAFAGGRADNVCCGGTIVIPLDDLAAVLPDASLHGEFIDAHAPTALCS